MRWLVLAVALLAGLPAAPPPAAPPLRPAQPRDAAARDPHLDVLFVGAHPDDEYDLLSTFGQWHQRAGVRTGIATITRGEGGGNAVGPEEGPQLGRLREDEERRAVGRVGVRDIHYLDQPDLYYTVSSPLTDRSWHHDDVLGRLVRIVRRTRPGVVATMDPAPTPGNHGNHQYSARLALEAYRAAADPSAYPEQLSREGLRPWAVGRVLSQADRPEQQGRACEQLRTPPSAPGRWYGVWGGRRSPRGDTWAQRERLAERDYRTQGWAAKADVPADPARIGCDQLTELANRAPHAPGEVGPEAALRGAALPGPGMVPLGTGLVARPERPQVVAGARHRVRVDITAPPTGLAPGAVSLRLPPGWRSGGSGAFGALAPGQRASVEFTVAPPGNQPPGNQPAGRVPVPVRLESGSGVGEAGFRWDVVPPVVAEQAPLPAVADFRDWAVRNGLPLLADAVPPVWTVPAGGREPVPALVHNYDEKPRSGDVALHPPAGFRSGAAQRFHDLAPGATEQHVFSVASTDPRAPTGSAGGDHHYALDATTEGGAPSRTSPSLELVPRTEIARSPVPPRVDGNAEPGEYAGDPLDLSARWEGEPCSSRQDCSATARLSWHGDELHALIDVRDDVQGARLPPGDCKRHWRTDAVELALDPFGRSENTSSTFKLGLLPRTDDPAAGDPPCFERDADNLQGPGPEKAPGTRVAARSRPGGYTVETAVPLADLPGGYDPRRLGVDLLVYDSDTRDRTGQTRTGWSSWPGVQGDPYRWGRASLAGRETPATREVPPPALPLEALRSVDSAPSVAQAVRLGATPGGAAPAGRVRLEPTGRATAELVTDRAGTARVFAVDAAGHVRGEQRIRVPSAGRHPVSVPLPAPVSAGTPTRMLVGFADDRGATAAAATPGRPG